MDKNEFIKRLSSLKTAISVTGKQYNKIAVCGDKVLFLREGKTQPEYISVYELFDFCSSEKSFNSINAKSYISGRVQSPAVAILNTLANKSLIKENIGHTILKSDETVIKKEKTKDETKFFLALSDLLDEEYLISKSIGKPVNSGHIFLSNNYKAYSLPSEIESVYTNLLEALKSDFIFSGDSLSHFVDGLVINHPLLGNRIIEFDEEQHFTPARTETLKELSLVCDNYYIDLYVSICRDLDYLNKKVLKKNRLSFKLEKVPDSFNDFVKWLESKNLNASGYIQSKNGFPFLGGRIAQRAYYDTLRDTAHLSSLNKDFSSPLRFAKKKFEDEAKSEFKHISQEILQGLIKDELKIFNQIEMK